jgi:cytochrome c oxidase assembly protein subunit 15
MISWYRYKNAFMMTSQITPYYPPLFFDHARAVATWLLVCAGMIFLMAIIGAITRLTESGLSITEWRPVTGVVPPTTPQAWQAAFDLYRVTPEYIHKNAGMTLEEFKLIYFWEWLHRLWGRLIGLVYAVPLVIFWLKGWLSPRLTWWLLALLVLGGLQGFVGWFMVQSGLVDRPAVSPYRLAVHLTLAMTLYALVLATALSLWPRRPSLAAPAGWGLKLHGVLAMVALAATIFWGALVAGLDAGLIYNEFPTMGAGRLMPVEMWHLEPAWLNLFENHAAVQFTHRWLAVLTVMLILALAVHALLTNARGAVYPALAVMALVQAGLGVFTLLSNVQIGVATLHQAGALVLLALMVVALHGIFARPRKA